MIDLPPPPPLSIMSASCWRFVDTCAHVLAGILAVVRSHPQEPRPYTGMVPIVSGEVAEDLANYLVGDTDTDTDRH